MRIAIVGSGIAGLAAAHQLARHFDVTLYESQNRLGGHAHSVDIELDGAKATVDTGFLVYNERTYPGLIQLFEELGVATVPTDMSFSVSVGPHGFEWCGSSLSTLFAQPGNALRPHFWRMLVDIVRFNRQALALLDQGQALDTSLGEFLAANRYGASFRDHYLLPMASAIWSCPMDTMLAFPMGSFARFFANHGPLNLVDRPCWHTVRGGSRNYVERIAARLEQVRLHDPVRAVTRLAGDGRGRVRVSSARGEACFDQVVLACHSDQALQVLGESATPRERTVLGAIRYQPNRACLHTDQSLMPRRRKAWAAWNYLSDGDTRAPAVSVTYWLNRLQPLPIERPVLLSLNPIIAPSPEHTIAWFDYEHPIFDRAAMAAQCTLADLQGLGGVWFAGAWVGYGFHEDGLKAGQAVARQLLANIALRHAA